MTKLLLMKCHFLLKGNIKTKIRICFIVLNLCCYCFAYSEWEYCLRFRIVKSIKINKEIIIYIHIYLYIQGCVHACIYSTYICTHTYIHTYMHTYTQAYCIYIYTYRIHTHTHTHTHSDTYTEPVFVSKEMRACMNTHVYIRTYASKHIYIYIYIYTCIVTY